MAMITTTKRLLAAAVVLAAAGCAGTEEPGPEPEREPDMADQFIERMDSLPPEERVPDWDRTRALMVREAPAVGDRAPDFELPLEDGSGVVRLSTLASEKPVVLVFGSYT